MNSLTVTLATLNAKYIHASLALRYLKSYCKRDFPDVHLAEYTIHDPVGQIVADLYQRKPDVVGFSTYIWNVEQTITVVKMLKQVLPSVVVVLGGPEVSYDVRYWLKRLPEVDFIVVGEGEATFRELLTRLRDGGDATNIPGTAHAIGGQAHVLPPAPKLDLDVIPNPYDDLADVERLRNRIVYFESSRGCPFSCQFCLSSIESGVRYFNLERVKSDLLSLIRSGVKTIKFVDRTFNLKKDYSLALFQFLIDHGGDTVFQFEITGDILPVDVVEFLAEHAPPGRFRFEIGVQSTNDVTNTLVHRRQNFERLSQTVTRIKSSGRIVQHLDLIAGLPEEDYQSFRKTFNDVFQLEPEELQLGFLKMLRGTGLRERASQHNYIFQEHAPYEILGNNILSFDDMIRIKQVEDVLEKYWNDGRLRNTVRYLVHHAYPSPFDFFQQFGTYWETQGWSRIGHQLKDLFLRLDNFLQLDHPDNVVQAARALMKLDYLQAFRIRPHEIWWTKALAKQDSHKAIEYFVANADLFTHNAGTNQGDKRSLSVADLEKHAFVDLLPCDLKALQATGSFVPSPSLLVVHYPPGLPKGEKPYTASVPYALGTDVTSTELNDEQIV